MALTAEMLIGGVSRRSAAELIHGVEAAPGARLEPAYHTEPRSGIWRM